MSALAGRRILITGGATGIGAAAVRALTTARAQVTATFHNTHPLDDVGTHWLHCDATDEDSVTKTVDQAVAHMGGLDVLVHAAGLWQAGIPGRIAKADIEFLMSTNLTATVLMNQAAHAVMKDTGGAIINFGSAEAVSGSPFSAVYAASKAAVQAWTRSAARAWAGDRVTVTALAPAVQTPGADRLRDFLGPEAAAALEQHLAQSIPLRGALGDPLTDLGPMLVFLAGTGAGFITGQLIAVDGGLMMLGG